MPSFLRSLSLFLAALALLYFGFRYGMREVEVTPTTAVRGVAEDPAWASWRERRFDTLGFSLRHPDEFPTAEAADRSYGAAFLAGGATAVYTVQLPKTRYKNTNFVHGFVTVAMGREEAAPSGDRSACFLLARPDVAAEPMTRRETFGGATFAVAGISGAVGGGVIGERAVYHTWARGRCVEITANLFRVTARRGVAEFDRADAWNLLTGIVHTYRPLDDR